MGILLYSIQIQFFSQNQSLLSLNPNQIIIKRVIQEYKRGEEKEDKNNLDAATTTPKVMVTTEWQAVCMDDMDNSYDGKFIPIFNYWTTASAPLIYSFLFSLLSPTNKDALRKKDPVIWQTNSNENDDDDGDSLVPINGEYWFHVIYQWIPFQFSHFFFDILLLSFWLYSPIYIYMEE